jgi:hypothetical protein
MVAMQELLLLHLLCKQSIFGRCCSITLPPILEPIAHLGRREASGLGQFSFFGRIWVRVLQVPFS